MAAAQESEIFLVVSENTQNPTLIVIMAMSLSGHAGGQKVAFFQPQTIWI